MKKVEEKEKKVLTIEERYATIKTESRERKPEQTARKGKNMNNKYEVWVTVWSDEYKQQIKKVAGEFDNYMNAKLFADAYSSHYSAATEIVEYTRK